MIISEIRHPVPAALALLALLALSACGSDSSAPAPERKKKEHLVEVAAALREPVQNELVVTGTIEAAKRVRLYSEISGRITYLPLHEGDAAAEHTIVIGLDDAQIGAELDKAIAARQQAQLDYERLQKLKPKNLASDEELANAATALEIAIAEEKLRQTIMNRAVIRAPFDGIVTERLVEPGDVVAEHSHILTLIDPQSLQVEIQLAEKWLPLIRAGDAVDIRVDALGKSVHEGRIARIHPTIDALTRKGIVEIAFMPVPYGARSGQLARVRLKTQAMNHLLIPAQALHHDTQGAYVFTVDDEGIAHRRSIEKGEQFNNMIAVMDGLGAGERLVTKGFVGLRDGKRVTVMSSGDPKAE